MLQGRESNSDVEMLENLSRTVYHFGSSAHPSVKRPT